MKHHVLIVLGVALLLAACGGSAPATPADPNAPTQTYAPIGTAPPEVFPDNTPTLYGVQPESLTTAELHERLNPLNSESVCQLPCYGGLVPGEGNIQDSIAFYSQLGIGTADLIPGESDIDSTRDGEGHLAAYLIRTTDIGEGNTDLAPPLVDVFIQNYTVQYVYVGWRYLPDYLTPQQVLQSRGVPSRIEMGVTIRENDFLYAVNLIYDAESGAYGFNYTGRGQLTEGQANLCFTDEQIDLVTMGTFAPTQTPMDGVVDQVTVQPADQVLGTSTSEIASQINSGSCITTTADQWQ